MAGKPTFDLADDEMEIGVGIHGEPGRERRPLATAREVVEIARRRPWSRTCRSPSGDQVLAFVNGMGGTPLMELYVVFAELHRFLEERGIAVAREPRRLVHDLAGHGRLLDHAARGWTTS